MHTEKKKTKILYVITKSNFGGAQKYVFDLAIGLPRDTFEVVVALGGNGILIEKLHHAGIRTIPIPSLVRDINPLKELRSFFELFSILRQEKPDVLHLNSSKIGVLGSIAGRLARTPRILFTAHGWPFNENRSSLSRWFFKLLSWITVLSTGTTIAVSSAIKKDLAWPLAKRKMVVIRNGIQDISLVARDEARKLLESWAHTTIPDDTYLVGTIAELHPSKGLPYAIQAFANMISKHPSARYMILGEGQSRPELERLITAHNLKNNVFLLGYTDNAAQYLKAFDCFLLPSTTEALGYVILEAGLARLPVVASAVGGIPEIISSPEMGTLTPPKDIQGITNALEYFIEHKASGDAVGSALEAHIRKNFTFADTLEKTMALYTKSDPRII